MNEDSNYGTSKKYPGIRNGFGIPESPRFIAMFFTEFPSSGHGMALVLCTGACISQENELPQ